MNPEAVEFRPRRYASETARVRINVLVSDNREGPFHEITNG